jgi:hypothetical protein
MKHGFVFVVKIQKKGNEKKKEEEEEEILFPVLFYRFNLSSSQEDGKIEWTFKCNRILTTSERLA